MSKVIGFYDSGIGGLPYLEWLKKHTTGCSFRYLAESAHFPFGIKTEPEIKEIVVESIGRFIEKEHPDLIVIACNTASVTALETLRQNYPIPFVGVVPAIKPAASISKKKSIGLFATNKTVSQLYTHNMHQLAELIKLLLFLLQGPLHYIRFFHFLFLQWFSPNAKGTVRTLYYPGILCLSIEMLTINIK